MSRPSLVDNHLLLKGRGSHEPFAAEHRAKVSSLEERFGEIETASRAGQKAATDCSLIKLDVEELKGVVGMIGDVEDKVRPHPDLTRQQGVLLGIG